MAALALDQGEGKHPPGRSPRAGPLEAPVGAEGASQASVPTLDFPPHDLPTRVAGFRFATTADGTPCRLAPPPWAGPGRLPWPAGGARPGAAPGSWPRTLRPLPAPFPPSSTPGVGDPEARRASEQKPRAAVVDVASACTSAAARDPPAPPPEAPSRPYRRPPLGAARPLALARPGPAPTPLRLAQIPTVSNRVSALSSFPGLVSWGPQARRLAPRRSAPARPRSGPL
nr:basic proline-rich protein-like [Globicephala melas]XP_030707279.1 basic proline-rich protein-like [Globicephala melas]XP_030707280.1 basic proline-rich protein-like [Globicephala melas]XP_030707281.1 basic proline-rich protein-like [Globicephala melas]